MAAEIDLPFDVPGGMPSYRKTLALSFLYKFWNAVSVELEINLDGIVPSSGPIQDVVETIHRNASTGRRDNSVSSSRFHAMPFFKVDDRILTHKM